MQAKTDCVEPCHALSFIASWALMRFSIVGANSLNLSKVSLTSPIVVLAKPVHSSESINSSFAFSPARLASHTSVLAATGAGKPSPFVARAHAWAFSAADPNFSTSLRACFFSAAVAALPFGSFPSSSSLSLPLALPFALPLAFLENILGLDLGVPRGFLGGSSGVPRWLLWGSQPIHVSNNSLHQICKLQNIANSKFH